MQYGVLEIGKRVIGETLIAPQIPAVGAQRFGDLFEEALTIEICARRKDEKGQYAKVTGRGDSACYYNNGI